MKKRILLLITLYLFIFSPHIYALTWPGSQPAHVTSGYGWRIHPTKGTIRWHNGIDIRTWENNIPAPIPIKSVELGFIIDIGKNDAKGNYIRVGNWEYLHLSDTIHGEWEFGKANKFDIATDTAGKDVWYFAILRNGIMDYYSSVPYIQKKGEQGYHSAKALISEGQEFAYSGNTGWSKHIHIHLISYNDPDFSPDINPSSIYAPGKSNPLYYLYGSIGGPVNKKNPEVPYIDYDDSTGMIQGLIASYSPYNQNEEEFDINKIDLYVDNKLQNEINFYKAKNAYISNGTSTGIDPLRDDGWLFQYYYLWDPHRCNGKQGKSVIELKASDIGNPPKSGSNKFYVAQNAPPGTNYPGCDHPDDNFSVSDTIGIPPNLNILTQINPSRVGVLKDGLVSNNSNLLDKNNQSFKFQSTNISGLDLKDTDLIVIPSGGLHALWNSEFFKQGLDDYVKNGGNLLVFSQQNGYEYGALPTPDGEPIIAYGWGEDQSCQFKSSYIDTYHPMLSSLNQSTPSINVDGYFSSYPESSTVLLRRVANGQPAAIMYQYGSGHIIATDFFSDFGLGSGQASSEELALIRDMVTWAKKPAALTEIKPGESVSVPITLVNNTESDAVQVKYWIYDPDRKELLKEEVVDLSLPVGSSYQMNVDFTPTANALLGIYHIDYSFKYEDEDGEYFLPVIDTGRFVVSNPLSNPYKSPDFNFSIQSDAEYYVKDSPAKFTFNLWNNTDKERQIRVT